MYIYYYNGKNNECNLLDLVHWWKHQVSCFINTDDSIETKQL